MKGEIGVGLRFSLRRSAGVAALAIVEVWANQLVCPIQSGGNFVFHWAAGRCVL